MLAPGEWVTAPDGEVGGVGVHAGVQLPRVWHGTGSGKLRCILHFLLSFLLNGLREKERGGEVLIWPARPKFSLQVIDPISLPLNEKVGLAGQTSEARERERAEERVNARSEGHAAQKESYMKILLKPH